jgi:hypothetical protein
LLKRLRPRLGDREDLIELGHPEDLLDVGVETAEHEAAAAGFDALLEVGEDAEGE